ncbi:MAG TPA: AAA family ATPase [Solirubrobacteraceae bacterium]|jgi:DNA-binding SARP family transcriptional activator/Cdc6-like AAA superfamily ATPase|nr:AAA family ATPase [Solirubrobacteraceae bacterium]
MSTRIWVCGRLRVSLDGESLEHRLERRQARVLAALLVLRRERPMRREELIEAIWPEATWGQHEGALRVLLSAVRRVFGPDALPGRTELRLELPEHVWIDVEQAAADVALAEAALRGERLADASAAAHSAAGLLAEPFLPGETAPWIEDARRELDDLAVSAHELEARAELQAGNPREAARAARELVARAPYREGGHALLMEALAAEGNTAEALLAYERLRQLLRDELGTSPAHAVSELHARLLGPQEPAGAAAAEPVPASSPETRTPEPPRLPVPVALAPVEGLPFVGREVELEAISEAWRKARGGARRVTLIAGEPGIGKTSLVGELARRADADGAIVLYGRCDEDVGFAFQPFVEALRAYVSACPPALLREQAGRGAPELARLLPELTELIGDIPPPSRPDAALDQYLMFEAVVGFLAAVAERTPVLLVLDDLHWAARPTLHLLRHLVRSPPDIAVCVVGTFRDTEIPSAGVARGAPHPLTEMLADLRREPGIERYVLGGLSPENIEALLAPEMDGTLDARRRTLARAVHEETEGNPFFVGEILRHVAEAGSETASGRIDLEQLGIPDGVREVVSRRLMRLTEGATRVLTVAAVAGPTVTLPLLERIPDAGATPDALLDALDEGVRARVLVESERLRGRYAFAHALVRQAIYADLTAARRGRLHRQVAEALEVLYAGELEHHLHELAHHFAQASAGEEDKAIGYLIRAGDQAQVKLAYEQALTHYRQALELLETFYDDPHVRERVEVTISLGEAQLRAGYRAFRDTLLEGARGALELGDPELVARAALANNRGFISSIGEVDEERVECLEQALELYDPAPSTVRARLLGQLAVELTFSGDWDLRRRHSEDAVAMARELGDPGTLAMVLCQRIAALSHVSTAAERIADADEATTIASELEDLLLMYYAETYRGFAALELGDLAAGDLHIDRQHRLAVRLRQPILSWYDLVIRAKRELVGGSLAEADRLALAGFEAGQEAGQEDAFRWYAGQLFVIRMHQGRLEEFVDALAAARRGGGRSRTVPMLTQALLAMIFTELGREDEARTAYERLMLKDLIDAPYDFSWLAVVALGTAAAANLGDRARAEKLISMLAPYRDRYVDMGSSWLGSVAHYLGLAHACLGDTEAAEACFEDAIAAEKLLGGGAWIARTRLAYADALSARGVDDDLSRAAELSNQALDTARSLGLGGILRQAGAKRG